MTAPAQPYPRAWEIAHPGGAFLGDAANATDLSDLFVPGAISAVPETSTWAMMLIGFLGLGFAFRQSRRKLSFA